MTEVRFEVVGAEPERFALAPTLLLRLRITAVGGGAVHAIALRAQVRIEPQRRTYDHDDEERLYAIFGEPRQWADSLRPFLWAHVGITVPGFVDETVVDLPLPCSYDLEVAGNAYLHALAAGEIPLLLLFSGTVFAKVEAGFAVQPITWTAESGYRLPWPVWRATMDVAFPNSGWVRVHSDTLDALLAYKAEQALHTWDDTFARLLKEAGATDG
jgi:hypothetical protein